MTLYARADIWSLGSLSGSNKDACFSGASNLFAVLNQDQVVQVYDTNTLAWQRTLSISGSVATGIAMVTSVCAVITFGGAAQVILANLSTGAQQTMSTGGGTTANPVCPQQVAGNVSTGFAMSTATTAGVRLITITGGTSMSLSTLSPAVFSGTTSTCVTPKSSNFLVGTANGKIVEMTTSGGVVSSFTLPTANNVGTTVTPNVCGLAWASPNVLAITNSGIGFVINWGASSITSEFLCGEVSNPASLCTAAGGKTLLLRGDGSNNSGYNILSEVWFAGNNYAVESVRFIEGFSSQPPTGGGYDSVNNKAYYLTRDGSNQIRCRIFDTSDLSSVNVDTRIQDPPTTDIAGRVINIRDNGPGRSQVETDQSVASGTQTISCSSGNRYTQLITNNLAGGSEKWDVREF